MADIRVAIVEDEPPARAKLRRLLDAHPDYRIVVEAEDVAGGLAALRVHAPDVLFLDIQLGGENGFDLLARASPPYPLIVFTTAFHEHALRAFEFAALDYLLKPFDRERFDRTLQRVGERLAARRDPGGDAADEERLRHLGATVRHTPLLRRIVVHERGRSVGVPIADVMRLSAAGNYVEVHTASRTHLVRATLARLAQRLDPGEFLRIHRSHLVRSDFIAEVAPWAHGDLKLTLKDRSELMMSRRYRGLLPDDWRPGGGQVPLASGAIPVVTESLRAMRGTASIVADMRSHADESAAPYSPAVDDCAGAGDAVRMDRLRWRRPRPAPRPDCTDHSAERRQSRARVEFSHRRTGRRVRACS
jgi:two-component system LytT family response regulator